MKKYILAITISIPVICAGVYGFHLKPEPLDVTTTVIIDKTDSFRSNLDPKETTGLINLGPHKWAGANVRITSITDFDHAKIQQVTLDQKYFLLSNPSEREKEIKEVRESVEDKINEINNEPSGRPKSTIYVPLIREANRLAGLNSERKILIAHSDCLENTNTFSIYRSWDSSLLKSNPDSVIKIFERMEKPQNLQGVRVYIVYQPKTENDNNDFVLMSGLFKKILEQAGAEVTIGANLINENN